MAPRPQNPKVFLSRLKIQIAYKLLPIIKSFTLSSTLTNSLRVNVRGSKVSIGVPQYWAVYYHDGSGPVRARQGRYLIWFTNPLRDDPRLAGRWPVRYSEWRHLTPDEYVEGLRRNREAELVGAPPFMIRARAVGRRQGSFFFIVGFTGTADLVEPLVRTSFRDFARSYIINEKLIARARI